MIIATVEAPRGNRATPVIHAIRVSHVVRENPVENRRSQMRRALVSELKLPSVNKIMISGRLTRDPEVRYTQSGTAVATMGVASSRAYRDPKDTSGAWKEETCFVNVVAWAQLAERCGDSLKKGSAVFVEGRLQSRSWETEEGNRRTVIEVRADRVQFLDKRGGGEPQPAFARQGGDFAEDEGGAPLPDDDLPF